MDFHLFKKTVEVVKRPFLTPYVGKKVEEQFVGKVEQKKTMSSDVGEEHPFDFMVTEGIYCKFGYVTGIVDKYVDFMVQGFYVLSDNEKSQEVIEKFLQDTSFDVTLRAWIKEALIKGNGFIEISLQNGSVVDLKVLDAKNIYVKRDEYGNVLYYNQVLKQNGKITIIKLEEKNIAHLKFNVVGNSAYGIGILYPALSIIDSILCNNKNMAVLMERKANCPYDITVGDLNHPETIPDQSTLTTIGANFDVLDSKHEWVHGPETVIKTLDIGNVGDKFTSSNEYYLDLLHGAVQVPAVLMGRASVAEGLANVQLDAFMKSVNSKQAEVEKVIEEKIFKTILFNNSLAAHVEFEWGSPSDDAVQKRIGQVSALLSNLMLSTSLRIALEEELVTLLDLEITLDPDEIRNKMLDQSQPEVPTDNKKKENLHFHLKEGCNCEVTSEELMRDYSIQEFVGFNYRTYKQAIQEFIEEYGYPQLAASSFSQEQAGYLTEVQLLRLKDVLKDGFKKEWSIRKIDQEISRKVGVKDLLRTNENGELLKDANGNTQVVLPASYRAMLIARTEVVRAANAGHVLSSSALGIEQFRFIVMNDELTCDTCMSLNGMIVNADEAVNFIPDNTHPNCRCYFIEVSPVTGK